MFQNLSSKLLDSINKITGRGRITEKNIKETMREIQKSLIDADVAVPVVKKFVMQVREKAIGEKIMRSLTPGQELIRIAKKELTKLMGEQNEELNLQTSPPAIVMLVGLQGSGKTTTTVKLARFLQEKQKKKVMVVSTDIYRPAAIEQLKVLADEANILFFPSNANESPLDIAKNAVIAAKKQSVDALLVDTAGRLHVDQAMMQEVQDLHKALTPVETLFIVDSMIGQDSVNTARDFNNSVPLTGVILTKIDGDSRGGSALSIKQVTEVPIKFLGSGEKTTALEPFHPDRVASRILGMGDVLSLIEQVEENIDKEEAKKVTKKMQKGKFDFNDFKNQLQQMQKMGGIGSIIDKLPGLGSAGISDKLQSAMSDDLFKGIEAIINSMTLKERGDPDLMSHSRKKRIARGCGKDIQEVNRFLKQFKTMQKMAKKFSSKGGMRKMMQMMQGIPGGGFPK